METVWLGRNNTIDLALRIDKNRYVDAPTPLNATNKLLLKLTDKDNAVTTFDSLANAAYFSTSTVRPVSGNNVRLVVLSLGSASLALGEYDCVLTVFTAAYPQGLVVGEFRISVRQPTT